MAGLKPTFQKFMNIMNVKEELSPYTHFLLRKIYTLLEDVYSVSTVTEIQEAIDAIGTGAGTIFIAAGTYTVDTTIDIDNCGSLVIYGHGDNTILEAAAGVIIFNITCCQSCIIKTLKLDINNYNFLSPNTQAVIVNETNNNVVVFQDVTIDGDDSNGIGIELQSNNCYIDQCNITDCKKGIYINNSDRHTISGNIITGHADYGIHADGGNYLTITSNTCGSNDNYGIYLDTITYTTVSGNICNSNTETGIYCDNSTNNTISNNSCSSNSENGIYITGCSYNTISGNTLSSNDSNSITAKAGLYITTNSDYNTITGNTVNNNNNAGLGTGYGIYIATATCDENVVASNNANGNDVDYMDSGTATTVEYYVQNTDELQDAIDSIGSKAGVINIDASFTVATTIDIDGNGSYIIEGEGSNSTLTTVGDITCFNIDTARQVVLRNFKIDASSLTTATKEIIDVNEDSDNIVILDNVIITGDGTNGYGIELNSKNCRIENCNISSVNIGINILSTKNILRGNTTNSNASYGIQISSDYNVLIANISNSNTVGIYLNKADYNLLNGNNCASNTLNGIQIIGTAITNSDYNALVGNFCVGNDSNTGNPQAGIYIDDYTDYTTIVGNTNISNNNAGVGDGYGIYIANNRCDGNLVQSNSCIGNDIQYWDLGTNTQIEYYVSTEGALQNAIDSIAAKSGTINIQDNFTISTTIDVDGGGSYVIQGEGDATTLTTGINITCFNITSARSALFQNFKIDASAYIAIGGVDQEIIEITEGLNNKVIINNVTITGDGNNGRGIEINSNNCNITNCNIDSVNHGIVLIGANYNLISNNFSITNALHGIYITAASDVNTISDNSFLLNKGSGIYIDVSDNNNISGNNCSLNELNGIYMNDADLNHLTSNICTGNDSNTANPQAGIHLNANCNDNAIVANMMNGNNNIGAGVGYGLYIGNANCSDNFFSSNHYSNNDVQWRDIGTNTDIVYRCSTNAEIQEAIDSIAAKSGIIIILADATFTVSTTIDIDGGGAYIIKGQGDNTILIPDSDISVFNITAAKSCTISDLKIDATALTTATKGVIIASEVSHNNVILERITIIGDSVNGYGIYITKNYVDVRNCSISTVNYGIYTSGSYGTFQENVISTMANDGIYLTASTYNIISDNRCTICNNGISLNAASTYNTINGNRIDANILNGIYMNAASFNSFVGNSLINNVSATANPQGAFYLNANCDKNSFTSNIIYGNTNGGAGVTYGIYIAANTSNKNTFFNNKFDTNEVNWKDSGINNNIEYVCSTVQEIQDAVDSIADKSGIITILSGAINITTTIDVDGGGSYIIEGQSDGTILTTVGDITCLNITSARSALFQNFKIDASSLTTATREIINITEGSNNLVTVDNVEIVGDGTNGLGIELNSNNCRIQNCNISNIRWGINALSDNNIIEGNNINSNDSIGIRTDGANYNNISSNICNSNQYGISIYQNTGCLVLGNTIKNNTLYGLSLNTTTYNTIEGNICDGNDSNTANPQAGISIDSNSNNNIIIGNTSINNNNAGAGFGYGIYIGNANCVENIVKSNNLSGNDVQWKDIGTNSDFEYRCSTNAEIQDAIDSIATKNGIITILSGITNITATINVNGGGDYIIEGKGDSSILTTVGDIICFNITSARTCTLRDFKIDASALTSLEKEIIGITEASDNKITLNNVTITGDGTNGIGIRMNSNNCIVMNCDMSDILIGIFSITGDNLVIKNNYCHDNGDGINVGGNDIIIIGNVCKGNSVDGIYLDSIYDSTVSGNVSNKNRWGIDLISVSNNNTIVGNTCSDNTEHGIRITGGSNYNTITGNNCKGNTEFGIYITTSYHNIVNGNNCSLNNLNSADDGGGICLYSTSDNNGIIGNVCAGNINAGAGTGYGIILLFATNDNNFISSNKLTGNDVDYLDNGTGTILFGDDTVYGAGWNADLGTATKNAIYDKANAMDALIAANTTPAEAVAAVEAAGIDFDTTKTLGFVDDAIGVFIDRVHDEDDMVSDDEHGLSTQQSIKAFGDAKISDAVYAAAWGAITTIAPSKNAVYDKIETIRISENLNIDWIQSATSFMWQTSTTVIYNNSINDVVDCQFYVHSQVDLNTSLVFTFIISSIATDAAVQIDKYVMSRKTNNTEGVVWDISNGVRITPAVVNGLFGNFTITIPSGSFAEGDIVHCRFILAENRVFLWHNASVAYGVK